MSYENHEEKWSTTSNWVCQPSHTKSRVSYPRRRVCTNQPIQLVPSWMPKPLPPRNQCTGCFAPALWDIRGLVGKSNHLPPYLFNSPIASDGNVDKIYLLQWYKDCESNFFFASLLCVATQQPCRSVWCLQIVGPDLRQLIRLSTNDGSLDIHLTPTPQLASRILQICLQEGSATRPLESAK